MRRSLPLLCCGWLLMEPPSPPPAAVTAWHHVAAFDTAEKCEAALAARYDKAQRLAIESPSAIASEEAADAKLARCIPAGHVYPSSNH